MHKLRSIFSYTIIEILLVIVLIGIWLAVVLPRFNSGDIFRKTKVKAAAHNIASDIRYARSLAITNAKVYIMDFDFLQNEYRIYKDSIAPENQIGVTKIIPRDVSCSGEDQLNFSSLGSASFAGGGIIDLSAGADQYRITVIAATGSAYLESL